MIRSPLRPWALRLHRWLALLFALPLLVVTASGLMLAAEPALKATAPPGTVTLARLEAVLAAAGPGAGGASLFIRAYDGTVTLGGRGAARTYDLATAAPAEPGRLAAAFVTARRLHETLLLDARWLVTASTVAMLLLAPLGLVLGWPKVRHTVGGWHRLVGWALLPLVIGSPLTGLALAFGISFVPAADPPSGSPPSLGQTVRLVVERHGTLDGLEFVRTVRGGARIVRALDAGGTAVTYRAMPNGLEPVPANWPRLLHEGAWGGVLGSAANALAGIALLGLLVTGLVLWSRRTLRRRALRRAAVTA